MANTITRAEEIDLAASIFEQFYNCPEYDFRKYSVKQIFKIAARWADNSNPNLKAN